LECGAPFIKTKRVMMRLRPGFFSALTLCLFIAALFILPTAAAHAILLESNPPLNGQVTGPDIPIKLRFNVRIDAGRSRLTLVTPDGATKVLHLATETTAETLTSQATDLTPGQYRLRWQVLASDGHLTRGEIPFTVAKS
jgi:methionine-rich copper-binding protein CopC